MKGRRARLELACSGLVAAVTLAAVGCLAEPKEFPNASPDSRTDVSAEQAFHDYGIVVPHGMRDLRYRAWSEDDEYPMAAFFTVPCGTMSDFVSRNALERVSDSSYGTVAVEVFAEDHGWTDTGTGATRYVREGGAAERFEVLVQKKSTQCTVYLHA